MDAIYRQTDRRVQEEEKAKRKSSALVGGADSFSVKETSLLLDSSPGVDHSPGARPQPNPITIQ
jgi:hypothetical protein